MTGTMAIITSSLFRHLVFSSFFIAATFLRTAVLLQPSYIPSRGWPQGRGREVEKAVPSDGSRTTGSQREARSKETVPLVSVGVPVYNGSLYISSLIEALLNQTYARLEFLFSLDASADADKSQGILQRYQDFGMKGDKTIRVIRHEKRLNWIANVNYLLENLSGAYVSILPVDDSVPTQFYESLARCLESDPAIVNCYPIRYEVPDELFTTPDQMIHQIGLKGKRLPRYWAKTRQPSILDDDVAARLEKAHGIKSGISFRGLVRRPQHGSLRPYFLPDLPHHLYKADFAQIVLHAIEGKLKEDYVPYFKRRRVDGETLTQRKNLSSREFNEGVTELFRQMYSANHVYASSSQSYFQTLLRHGSLKEDELRQAIHTGQNSKRVAVLGAGIQGCVMALMFRRHGYDVVVIDKMGSIMQRASAAGEGKIHMGFVYNKDLTMKTAVHMMKSALRFSSYLDYVVGEQIPWAELKSEAFSYLIPYSSLVSPSEFESYSAQLEQIYKKILSSNPGDSYLGSRPDKIIERIPLTRYVNSSFFEAMYTSEEYAIEPNKLKKLMENALISNGVKLAMKREISGVQKNYNATSLGDYQVLTNTGTHDFDFIVNCLWEGRHAIDKTMDLPFNSGNNVRFKFGLKFSFMEEYAHFPSFTIVNGPFGDFVRYDKGVSDMYFSYYPSALIGMTNNETAMMEWDGLASGIVPNDVFSQQLEAHWKGFQKFFPLSKAYFDNPKLGGGYILGNGKTGITDPNSELHERSDYPFMVDQGYISVSTQKLTSAPYNAYLLEKELFPRENFDTVASQDLASNQIK